MSLLNPSIATNDLKHKTRKRTLVRVYCVTVIVVEYTSYVLVLDTLFYRWPPRYSKLTHSVFYHHQGHNINRWQRITTLCRQRIIPLCRQPITTLCRQPITPLCRQPITPLCRQTITPLCRQPMYSCDRLYVGCLAYVNHKYKSVVKCSLFNWIQVKTNYKEIKESRNK